MVGDKYTQLDPARQALFSLPVLRPSCTSEIGEVFYSLTENMTDISTRVFQYFKLYYLYPIVHITLDSNGAGMFDKLWDEKNLGGSMMLRRQRDNS